VLGFDYHPCAYFVLHLCGWDPILQLLLCIRCLRTNRLSSGGVLPEQSCPSTIRHTSSEKGNPLPNLGSSLKVKTKVEIAPYNGQKTNIPLTSGLRSIPLLNLPNIKYNGHNESL
jgi:hypothetical protein